MSELRKENIQNIYTLSPMQEGMFYHNQLNKNSAAYFEQTSYTLAGELNIDIIEKSLNEIVKRYDVLRTVFISDKSEKLLQVVLKERKIDFKYEEIPGSTSRTEYIKRAKEKDKNKLFDLSKDMLMRVTILKLANNEYELIWSHHHIIMDGWCLGIVINDFFTIYSGLLNNKKYTLATPVQFGEFIKWLNTRDTKATKEYWAGYLKNYSNNIEIKADWDKPGLSLETGYKQIERKLSRSDYAGLQKVASAHKVTMSTLIQTLWGVMLGKLYDVKDVVFGSVVSGRTSQIQNIDSMLGLFINTIPFRVEFDSESSVTELIEKTQQSALSAEEHHYYSLSELQKLTPLGNKLINHIIAFENFPLGDSIDDMSDSLQAETGIKVVGYDLFEITNYPFCLTFIPSEELLIKITYDSSAISSQYVERILSYYETVIANVLGSPQKKITDVELIPDQQKEQIVKYCDNSGVAFPENDVIQGKIENIVSQFPHNEAVRFDGKVLDYSVLNALANKIAHRLRAEGVGRNTIVGICINRSFEMLAGILGILKAGGAYLPIDPDYPVSRIQYLIEDSGITSLLVGEDVDVPVSFKGEAINIATVEEWDCPVSNPEIINKPDDLAYIIYTSGTTGKPKGVMVSHKNLIRLYFNDTPLFDFNQNDNWCLFHSFSFDFSVWEIFGAFFFGGALTVVPKLTAKDPEAFGALLEKDAVTVLNQTPSAFYNLSDTLSNPEKDFSKIRYVIFGGEALSVPKLVNWQDKHPQCKLINMYGITEITIHGTFKEITKDDLSKNCSNIGFPLPTSSLFVLDSDRNILPLGEVGELYVGGYGVAKGYYKREELTSERFIQAPWKTGEILYKSGDLARLLPDGDFEYIGRADRQVQLHGFRIELSEIENNILSFEGIKDAVVLVHNSSANQHLKAFLITEGKINIEQLKEYIAGFLPYYMIPSYFVEVESFPLTAHGKIDTGALEKVEVSKGEVRALPETEQEKRVAAIWSKLLKVDTFDVSASFFSVGGDSILSIKLVSEINKLGYEKISVADVYANNSIRKQAAFIAASAQGTSTDTLDYTEQFNLLKNELADDVGNEDVEDVYPMTDIEKGIVFYYQKAKQSGMYHDQATFYYPIADLNEERFSQALTLLALKHDILRSCLNFDDYSEPLKIIRKEPQVNYTHFDLQKHTIPEQEQIIEKDIKQDIATPFNEKAGDLWRITTYQLTDKSIALFVSFHHAILDGWSLASMMVELSDIYKTLCDDDRFVPAKLASTYKDSLIAELATKENKESANFWKEKLSGAERTALPVQSTSNNDHLMTTVRQKLNIDFEQLQQLAQKHSTSIKNICFSAYVYTLNMLTYGDEVLVGCVTNTRAACEDGEKVLGCFLNTIPVKVEVPAGMSWAEYILFIEEEMQKYRKHQNLSLFEIARLTKEQNHNKNPFFDTLFNYVDFHVYNDLSDEALELENEIRNNFDIKDSQITNTLFDFEISVSKDEITLMPKYNVSIIGSEFVSKFCGLFIRVLDAYLQNPHKKAVADDILPSAEKQRILFDFNKTKKDFSEKHTLTSLFEKSAYENPGNIAVQYSNGSVTYQELMEKSAEIAACLHSKGVSRGDSVVIVMDRCPEVIGAVLGILKLCATYVPVEPFLPQNRISGIVQNTNPRAIITSNKHADKILKIKHSLDASIPVICPDGLIAPVDYVSSNEAIITHKHIEGLENVELGDGPQPDDVAYVIFTSGTTGVPKGVVVKHKPAVNLIEWLNEKYAVSADDTVLFITSLSFDLSVYDIFGILSAGATIRLCDNNEVKTPETLLHLLAAGGITIWDSAPAAMQQLVPLLHKYKSEAVGSALRLVLLSGDWIPLSMPEQLWDVFEGVKVISLGGATEATIWSNYYDINEIDRDWKSIPYGKPIQNAQYYILNNDLSVCPLGVPGNLFIGGKCLAEGYLHDEELTNKKFIKNPFVENERMYDTGDLARWYDDGNIEFLGRKDSQVKVRGYRIELGEIESKLIQLDQIKSVVALTKKDNSNQNYIVVFYTSDVELEKEFLKRFLAEELPAYMIPELYLKVDEFPVTANGKLDRKALLDNDIKLAKTLKKPQNEMQAVLVRLWSEILKIDPETISVDSDFFELGGHSLNATILSTRIHKETNKVLKISDLYRFPTIEQIADHIIKQNKNAYSEIETAPTQPYYPLSAAQKRLFVLNQLKEGNVAYNICQKVYLKSSYEVQQLEDIFNCLIMRHESLRTRFDVIDGEPVQIIDENGSIKIQEFEMTDAEAELYEKDFIKPFDLKNGPLVRACLINIKGKEPLFLFDMHHIITDGFSQAILVDEFNTLLSGASLKPIKRQYKDYVYWQNKLNGSDYLLQQETFWETQLSAGVPELDLPIDFNRPNIQSFAGAKVRFFLGKENSSALKALAIGQSATNYSVFLTIINILLSKIANQNDVILGTTVAGRRHSDLEQVVGYFINMLAVKSSVDQHSYVDYLRALTNDVQCILDNQDVQFEFVVDKFVKNRDLSRHPLFDVVYNMVDTDQNAVVSNHCNVHQPVTTKFDLTFNIINNLDDVEIQIEYSTALFQEETINRIIGYFGNILNQIVGDINIPIQDIKLIGSDEENTLLNVFNDTSVDLKDDLTVCDLFEKQVNANPDSEAVIYNDQRITYLELNERANSVAAAIIEQGGRQAEIIPLIINKSIDHIVAILGIMKAGCAYLPIDPALPGQRLDFMLNESKASVIVTNKESQEGIASQNQKLIIIDDLADRASENYNKSESGGLAYVIYTSGSTGKPKGVMVEHHSLVNFCMSFKALAQLKPTDSTFHMASISFDASVIEIFPHLICGASIHVLPKEIRENMDLMNRYLNKQKITVGFLTTQLYQLFKEKENTSLRCLFTGGEKLASFKQKPYTLFNLYGPTEATVFASAYLVENDMPNIPIGKPIQNTKLYVLNDALRLQPIGTPGELFIGGDCVARGYLNDEELTTERFIDNPFVPGERIYKTGDMVRWLADGTLEFLNRKDRQIKKQGYRIEPGEIERHLLQMGDINSAFATDIEVRGAKYICMYYVSEKELENQLLTAHLLQFLPNYMMPDYFVPIQEIPLTNNGKVDKHALPVPRIDNTQEVMAPNTELERSLRAVWSEILQLPEETIGINSDFFQLGGQSIKAMSLVSNVFKEFNVQISLTDIFDSPTILGQAGLVNSLSGITADEIPKTPDADFYPVSPAQKRMFMLFKQNPDSVFYNIPNIIQIDEGKTKQDVENVINALFERHSVLKTIYRLQDEDAVQIILKDARVQLDCLENIDDDKLSQHFQEFISPINIEQEMPVHFLFVTTKSAAKYLFIDIHHIASDDRSLKVLISDFQSLLKGEGLSETELEYKDYAVWMNHQAKTDKIENQKKFFLNAYSDSVPLMDLKPDYERPKLKSYTGDSILFDLDVTTHAMLKSFLKNSNFTLFNFLFAAYNVLISRVSNQTDVVIGVPVAGRDNVGLHNIVGMFSNTLAMRNQVDHADAFSGFLSQISESSLLYFKNQDFQFNDLVESLNMTAKPGRNPIFDICFNFLEVTNEQEIDIEVQADTAKFDLTLFCFHADDRISFNLEFSTELFKRETAEKYVKYFTEILRQILSDPDIRIKDISLLSKEEKEKVISYIKSSENEEYDFI